jgi:DNA-directed RNA polymerase specialized sigma subunit
MDDEIAVENCRKLLRRAAWRIQYKTRIKQLKECQMLFEDQAYDMGFEADVLSRIYVENLLNTIPWEKCKFIIKKTVLEGVTEQEVARQLNITQQGVNKWKKRGLELLRENLTNSCEQ